MTFRDVTVAAASAIPLAGIVWLALTAICAALGRLKVHVAVRHLYVFLVAWVAWTLIVLFTSEATVAPIRMAVVSIMMLGILLWFVALLLNLFGIGRRSDSPSAGESDGANEGESSSDVRKQ